MTNVSKSIDDICDVSVFKKVLGNNNPLELKKMFRLLHGAKPRFRR